MANEHEPVPILFESYTPIGGFNVRLPNNQIEPFENATKVDELADGGIDIWFDHIYRGHYAKGEYLGFYPVSGSCERRDMRRPTATQFRIRSLASRKPALKSGAPRKEMRKRMRKI